jgi:membrane associated rhomboid family serine protease
MFKSIWDDFTHYLKDGNMIVRLIIINVLVFLVMNIAGIIFNAANGFQMAYNPLAKFFGVSADLKYLALHPWGLFTNMFVHVGFWHIFWNMLLLYWFGRITGDLINDRRILPLYVMGGFAGALLFICTAWILPGSGNYAIGASAAVMAIVVAAGVLAPDYRISLILFETQLKYVVAVMVFLDIVGASVSTQTNTGHFAHLGGAVFGWYFVYSLKRGSDLSVPFNNATDKLKAFFLRLGRGGRKKRPQPTMGYKNKERIRKESRRQEQNQTPGHRSDSGDVQARIDEILDKIRKHGISSLTQEEQDFLNNSSNKID